MKEVLHWALENSFTIVIVLIFVVSMIFVMMQNKEDLLHKAALHAVSVAEKTWGSKTGQIKFAEVYTTLKTQFPIITLFMPEQQLKDLIENALADMKKILQNKQKEEQLKQQATEAIEETIAEAVQ
jgi:nucleotide-binding universal stress UspA family protein